MPSVSFAQKSQMTKLFEEGVECLNQDGENCVSFFNRAIRASKKLKDDTSSLILILDIVEAYEKKGGNPSERIEFNQVGIDLAEEKKNIEFQWRFHTDLGETYGLEGKFEKQTKHVERSIQLAQEANDPEWSSIAYLLKSQNFMQTARYPEAVKAALKGKEFAKDSKDKKLMVRALDVLSGAYFYNKDYTLSAKYLVDNEKLHLELGDTLNAMYCLTNWCNVQSEMGNNQKVVEKLPEAIDYFKRKKLHTRAVFPMAQLGKAYNNLGKHLLAVSILEEAYQQCLDLKIEMQAAYCAILLSESHHKLNNYEKSLHYSTLAYDYHKNKTPSPEYLGALRKHSQALISNEKYKEATTILIDYIECKDSIFNKEKMEEIAFLQEKFETQAKNDEIKLLQQEKETIKNRNIGLIVGLILTAIIGFLLIKRKSIKIKLKEAENEKMNIEIDSKNKELTSQALHLAQKNELLISLKNDLSSIADEENQADIKSLEQKIKFDEQIDQNWEQFTKFFNQTKSDFFKNLTTKHTSVGKSDLRMSALISMNLDSKEIASILNISSDGVKKARYRLRKKLGLESKDDLTNYLTQF